MSDRVLYICGVLCVAPCARVLWALYICGVVCVAPCARVLCISSVWSVCLRARVCSVYLRRALYICGVLNCDAKIAIYQDLFTYVIDVI